MLTGLVVTMALLGAEPAPPPPSVWTNPDWDRKPTEMDVVEFYPLLAALTAVEGQATIGCTVALSGSLEACEVVSESPSGRGFGAAALKLSKILRMRPATLDGKPVADSRVNVPIAFKAGGVSARLPGLTESLSCIGRFSARARVNPGDEKAVRGVEWSSYWANKLMRGERIPKDTRVKRLASAAAPRAAPPPSGDADARCEAAFLPEPMP